MLQKHERVKFIRSNTRSNSDKSERDEKHSGGWSPDKGKRDGRWMIPPLRSWFESWVSYTSRGQWHCPEYTHTEGSPQSLSLSGIQTHPLILYFGWWFVNRGRSPPFSLKNFQCEKKGERERGRRRFSSGAGSDTRPIVGPRTDNTRTDDCLALVYVSLLS